MDGELIIDWIGGNCPVQAEGTIVGKPFYFRARGRRWTFEVGDNVLKEDDTWGYEWCHEEPYGDTEFAAGWMTEDEARSFVALAAERYLREMSGETG